jgi:hypothetical protein
MAVGLLAGGAAAREQALADVAKQERERRKAIKEPARVYTEADVEKTAPLTTAASREKPAAPGAKASVASGEPHAKASPDAKDAKAEAPQDEAAWQARIKQASEDLARSRRLLSAMEQQLVVYGIQSANAVAAGKPAPQDGRAQESAGEVERLRAEVEKYSAALAQIQSEARAAGVPPGWVR